MKLIISENKEKLNAELAQWISELISSTLHHQEIFTIALAGGSTPGALYSELALNYTDKINWAKVHVFWGDERFVPPGDERNNAKMADDKLLQFVNVPSAQVHRMRTDIQPLFAASEYQQILKHYFKNTISSFDLVLLGLGDDGHTLSLF
ncbi:MAG: 6-phosphogluconolactonase, partial [Ginsengibacter sp.]